MGRRTDRNRRLQASGSSGEPRTRLFSARNGSVSTANADKQPLRGPFGSDGKRLSAIRMGRPSKQSRPTPIHFYGYPVEVIEAWCGVSRQTACLYKSGARKPSRQALRLFTLHRDGRVLGPEWREWAIVKDKLISPEGQETTHGQLNAYWLVMQLARELARDNPKATEDFHRILRSA